MSRLSLPAARKGLPTRNEAPTMNGAMTTESTVNLSSNCAIKKKRGGLWLTSIRSIEQDEELLIDYAFDLGEEFEPCRCGHPRCRGLMLRKKDWPKLRRIMSKISK